jgi:hypothetical protein
MPRANPTKTSQYKVQCAAGGAPNNPQPANARRVMLEIQNVGINEGHFWFDLQSNGGIAQRLGPMASRKYDVACPKETVFYSSILGTTFAVIEGYDNDASAGRP